MNGAFAASGVISITTDFGHRGAFVGTMKGVILRRLRNAQIVDLTHEIHVHWPAEAGFWLERSYRYFPEGSVHLAVVDPGVGTDRNVLLAVGNGHAFLAPDNGLLAGVIERSHAQVYKVDPARLRGFGIDKLSATFHGRDLFAPLAAELAAGKINPAQIGTLTRDYVPELTDAAHRRGGEIHGTVITTDHFGNLITNIEAEMLAPLKVLAVRAAGHRIPFRRTYCDVAPGSLLALVNSCEVLEIAAAEQNASALIGLSRGGPVVVEVQ